MDEASEGLISKRVLGGRLRSYNKLNYKSLKLSTSLLYDLGRRWHSSFNRLCADDAYVNPGQGA